MMISEVKNIDCMIGMKEYPDKYFDLAVVDPPYGIGEDGRRNHTRSNLCKANDYRSYSRYDVNKPKDEYFKELFRVSKEQIIWGANHFGNMPASSCWLIWDKDNGENDFADCELAWTSFKGAARKFKWRWNGMLQQDMKNKQKRIHPNEKPVPLYSWIYHNYLPQGGKVLDSHLGSGSNRIAAYKAGNIDFTGFDLDKDYLEAQEKRFKQFISQTTLKF